MQDDQHTLALLYSLQAQVQSQRTQLRWLWSIFAVLLLLNIVSIPFLVIDEIDKQQTKIQTQQNTLHLEMLLEDAGYKVETVYKSR